MPQVPAPKTPIFAILLPHLVCYFLIYKGKPKSSLLLILYIIALAKNDLVKLNNNYQKITLSAKNKGRPITEMRRPVENSRKQKV